QQSGSSSTRTRDVKPRSSPSGADSSISEGCQATWGSGIAHRSYRRRRSRRSGGGRRRGQQLVGLLDQVVETGLGPKGPGLPDQLGRLVPVAGLVASEEDAGEVDDVPGAWDI